MSAAAPSPPDLERVPTGIPGLDTILRGGLPRGGIYLVEGHAGTGKTILASQLAFARLAAGARAVYVTLLTESHSRLLAQLRTLAFFDPAAVGDALYFLSAAGTLEDAGLDGVLDLVRRAVRERRATLLVVDGAAVLGEAAAATRDLRRFLLGLQALLETIGGTALLLAAPDTFRHMRGYADV